MHKTTLHFVFPLHHFQLYLLHHGNQGRYSCLPCGKTLYYKSCLSIRLLSCHSLCLPPAPDIAMSDLTSFLVDRKNVEAAVWGRDTAPFLRLMGLQLYILKYYRSREGSFVGRWCHPCKVTKSDSLFSGLWLRFWMENGWVNLCFQLFYKSADEELQAWSVAANCLLLILLWLVGCWRNEGERMWKFRKGFQTIFFSHSH